MKQVEDQLWVRWFIQYYGGLKCTNKNLHNLDLKIVKHLNKNKDKCYFK